MARTLKARYAGECGTCGATIEPGATINYGGRGRVSCEGCPVPAAELGATRARREARAERRRDWAEGRAAKAGADLERARSMAGAIPFGQPIHVGHHSERTDRNYRDRISRTYERGFEHAGMADRHERAASTLEAELDRAIYSDDVDALERLDEKIAGLEAQRATRKAENAAYRKAHRAELAGMTAYQRGQAVPWPPYSITNLTGNIGRLRKRRDQIARERAA